MSGDLLEEWYGKTLTVGRDEPGEVSKRVLELQNKSLFEIAATVTKGREILHFDPDD